MLLCHALALHERGIPLHANVLPLEGETLLNLRVTHVDEEGVEIPTLSEATVIHGLLPGATFEEVETEAGRITIHVQGDDPASALLAAGMTEDQLNQMVLKSIERAKESGE